MNVSQVTSAIMQGQWTNDQISSIADAVKFARARLTDKIKYTLKTGDNVCFENKEGRLVTGFVEKVAIKYVTVKTIGARWKVPASMLTRIADEREYA